ncbi:MULTISPECIES: peptide chain release factor N(5)-glutamine methyltransferase [unclassified Roseateles]|uniref:peptide chain release factor N(5)-glutamine methyltransferase n=1 Tax=unclassified Roseateles TaxID=2626991 RepID=UPI0006FF55C0|nr:MULTISPECIES: peptide chain release factor N(5)-glutamine methyltransferase [unclassified Roseateles]KQW51734.1 protein-(glutamine-N5) methyltransferase, release factor-specific [Pelomonas sp. Root405]KRA77967.1 protein-(glutamine-N5) methyltransferase, release factor-specific [Pelomonas sp. Root662]
MTVDDALALARQLGVERGDAQTLIGHLTGHDRAWLIAHGDALVTDAAAALRRLAAGEPLAHLTGCQPFHGLMLQVTPATLIPRADTETLVDWALELLADLPGQPSVVDLGTGSGAIALAIKAACPRAKVTAVDFSADALAIARANGERLALSVDWHHGSWFAPLAGQHVDLIVSNPPYIAANDPHLPALRHEPITALTAGGNGMADLQTLIDAAPQHLNAGGWLLLEHGWDQAAAVADSLGGRGFTQVQLRRDLGDRPRASGGCWPATN